jgi:serine/threonine protein phosphatase PrpC
VNPSTSLGKHFGQVVGAMRRVFRGTAELHERRDDPTEEMPIVEPEVLKGGATGFQPSPHDLQIGLASDPGRVRDHNEDASLAWQFVIAQQGQPPLPIGLFVVADGMGGHARGEQASSLAVRLTADHVIRQVCLPLLAGNEGTAERAPIHEVLNDSVSMAHEAINRRFPQAGTTMTMALMLGDGIYIAHVGDSRAYLGERGDLRPITQDHSVAARLLEMGQATPEEVSPQRNILYKALGQGARVEPDIMYYDLERGQYLLICCDGLWGKVSDSVIATTIEAAPTPDQACQELVALANLNGGEDNISVILVARGWPLPVRAPSEEGISGIDRPSDLEDRT